RTSSGQGGRVRLGSRDGRRRQGPTARLPRCRRPRGPPPAPAARPDAPQVSPPPPVVRAVGARPPPAGPARRRALRGARGAAPRAGGHEAPTPEPDAGFLGRLERLPPWAPAPPAAADWLQDDGRLGQYEVLGKLGQGGMGAVYQARHVELGKVVAVKVLPTE